MVKLIIDGGRPLEGSIRVEGAKNAALPILAASVMAEGAVKIDNVPDLLDIHVMLDILRSLGAAAALNGKQVLVDASSLNSSEIPETLMNRMRSSIFLMGPLLSRCGEVTVYQPGGCAIGERKIDLHLKGLEALGATVTVQGNRMICRASKLKGADIMLDYPSVGATENLMMAAATAEGVTTISNAAREPEIVDLQMFLNRMGARIQGAGTDMITIEGVEKLYPCEHRVIPDRIVTGTLMIAVAATRGNAAIEGAVPGHLTAVIHALRRAGFHIAVDGDIIHVTGKDRPRAVERIVTSPYPAFPTDLQAQMMVLLSLADGLSIIKETVFEGRFKHVSELAAMGADIRVDLNCAFVRGVPRLYGAAVEATDLRAGAALVIAGLAAVGRTIVDQVHHIDRGYSSIEKMFQRLGARIERSESVIPSRLASSM